MQHFLIFLVCKVRAVQVLVEQTRPELVATIACIQRFAHDRAGRIHETRSQFVVEQVFTAQYMALMLLLFLANAPIPVVLSVLVAACLALAGFPADPLI